MTLSKHGYSNSSLVISDTEVDQINFKDETKVAYTVDFECELEHDEDTDQYTVITKWIYIILHKLKRVVEFNSTERFTIIHPNELPPDEDLNSLVRLTFEHLQTEFEGRRRETKELEPIRDISPGDISPIAKQLKTVLLQIPGL